MCRTGDNRNYHGGWDPASAFPTESGLSEPQSPVYTVSRISGPVPCRNHEEPQQSQHGAWGTGGTKEVVAIRRDVEPLLHAPRNNKDNERNDGHLYANKLGNLERMGKFLNT